MKNQLINLAWISALISMGARVFNDGNPIETLKNKLVDLDQSAQDIVNRADAEGRDLTDDETEQVDSILAEFKQVEKDIDRRERLIANNASITEPAPRRTEPAIINSGVVEPVTTQPGSPDDMQNNGRGNAPRVYRQPRDPAAESRHGFNNFGEFARSVRIAAHQSNPYIDPRLIQNAPTTVSTEGTGADGGFAVPPEFRSDIRRLVMGEDNLITRTDQLTTSSNAMTFPKDETTPWQTSGGIQSYWEGENNQLSQSKIALESNMIRLNKLTTLVPVTEELLDDASGLDSYLRAKVPEKMDFKITDAIVNGNGAGKPKGILNAEAKIEVAKEGSQAADTVVFANIINMWARMYGPSKRNAVWLINQDIEPQLYQMSFEGTSSSVPAYMPAGGLSDSPYGRLMGRPVIETQAAQTLGDAGDIMLVDLSKYLTISKTEGMRSDVSMHLWFDYDTLAYRFIIRLAGQSWYNNAITPKNSSNTLSPFVTLAARA